MTQKGTKGPMDSQLLQDLIQILLIPIPLNQGQNKEFDFTYRILSRQVGETFFFKSSFVSNMFPI